MSIIIPTNNKDYLLYICKECGEKYCYSYTRDVPKACLIIGRAKWKKFMFIQSIIGKMLNEN